MIWIVFAILALGVALWLAPALLDAPDVDGDEEIQTYLAEIDHLDVRSDMDDSTREAARLDLQRRILDRRGMVGGTPRPVAAVATLLALIVSSGTLYAFVGQPSLSATTVAENSAQTETRSDDEELSQLVEQLGQMLQGTRADDPLGWQIYARTLIRLERYEEAIEAYDRAVALSDDAALMSEREQARAFIAARTAPGPSQDDIDAAASLSDADRAAMIQSMVDGLSARLEDDPRDAAGWVRLIRARVVLGQEDVAEGEIERLRAAFAEDPETVASILRQAGWPS